jgi:hypothetical protein
VKQELPKSKSLPRTESKWGIFDKSLSAASGASAAVPGSIRLFDTTRKKYGKQDDKNNALMGRQIAEDDESLKVFMQAWNMLDTFEGRSTQ